MRLEEFELATPEKCLKDFKRNCSNAFIFTIFF